MVGHGEVDYFSFLTIISDIQRAINNRSLTYLESVERELEAVTPSMFLRTNENLNDRDFAPSMPASQPASQPGKNPQNHAGVESVPGEI